MTNTPPPAAPPEASNADPAGFMARLVRLVRQIFCAHRFDLSEMENHREIDDTIKWACWKCGKQFSESCGLEVLSHGDVEPKPFCPPKKYRSEIERLYMENSPRLVWDGEKWVSEPNASRIHPHPQDPQ